VTFGRFQTDRTPDYRTVVINEPTPEGAPPAPLPQVRPVIPRNASGKRLTVVLAVALVVVMGLQVLTMLRVGEISSRLDDLQTAAHDVDAELGTIRGALDAIEGDIAAIDIPDPAVVTDLATANPGTASAAPTVGESTSGLPRFTAQGPDPAVGMVLTSFGGTEYYTSTERIYDATDGVARAIFVWAHWCPYCQQEMPLVADWQSAFASDHPNLEIVSVTTAMNPDASNPLEPYLDSGQYPFPVIVDADGSLAASFGVNAFPFWLFVDADGKVLARHAGLLGAEQLDAAFRQLNDIGAEPTG